MGCFYCGRDDAPLTRKGRRLCFACKNKHEELPDLAPRTGAPGEPPAWCDVDRLIRVATDGVTDAQKRLPPGKRPPIGDLCTAADILERVTERLRTAQRWAVNLKAAAYCPRCGNIGDAPCPVVLFRAEDVEEHAREQMCDDCAEAQSNRGWDLRNATEEEERDLGIGYVATLRPPARMP